MFLLCCVVSSHSVVSDSCNPMDCSPTGPFVRGISYERILEQVAISFPRESSWPRNQTQVFCIASRFFTNWATREAHWQDKKSKSEETDELDRKIDFHLFAFVLWCLLLFSVWNWFPCGIIVHMFHCTEVDLIYQKLYHSARVI